MAYYRRTSPTTWHGRIDSDSPDDMRWHQRIAQVALDRNDPPPVPEGSMGIALLGFCCDAGVRRNQGRDGAFDGPAAIRKACCNLPYVTQHALLIDAGDIVCDQDDMEPAQELLGSYISSLRQQGYLPVVMGGGHEVSYGSFLGMQPLTSGREFGTISWDAHFDLRPYDGPAGTNSGTWARQIRDTCKQAGIPWNYLVIGVQPYSNTPLFFELAEEMGAPYQLAENFTNDQLEHLLYLINGVLHHCDRVMLTIDLDVFAAPHAPGVSAPAFNGIAPNAMSKRLLRHIMFSGKVGVVDIAEMNPRFDIDARTARLAASLIFDIVKAAELNTEYPG